MSYSLSKVQAQKPGRAEYPPPCVTRDSSTPAVPSWGGSRSTLWLTDPIMEEFV